MSTSLPPHGPKQQPGVKDRAAAGSPYMARPYPLLTLTALFWGGNAVAGKLAVGEISPMALTSLRWILVCLTLWPFLHHDFRAAWPILKARWPSLTLMGGLGFTGFNALFYLAAHHTSGVNLTILQGSIPVLVILGASAMFGTKIQAVQIIGMLLTIAGVMITAAHGDLTTLTGLAFNIGDAWMLIACVFYAGYTLALRNRPALPGLSVFAALAMIACLTSLPLLGWEIASGTVQWPTPKGWIILLYVAFFPSLIAQIFFIRGVELIGPGRAGLFVNLVPVFGACMAVLILDEHFAFYHALALALVIGGILIAERGKRAAS
jgi:drug/metabolite transporter (DMT)-like permease